MEKEKIQIKLKRHKWPDEVEKEKEKKTNLITTIVIVIVSLAIGFSFGGVFYKQEPLASNPELARFERVYNRLLDGWFFTNDMEDPASQMIENAIHGMIDRNGDEHTSYMTLEQSQMFTDSIDMSFVGIGVQYFTEENLITRVFKDSPAEKAGILPGDIMVAVDDIKLSDLTEDDDLRDYILGERGTAVNITVNRLGDILTFEVIRDAVNALTWGEMLNNDTGYLEIASFGSSLRQATEIYLEHFKASNVKNLIIDFRDNGGGYLDAINDLSTLFFEPGTTVYFEKFTTGNEVEYKVNESGYTPYTYENIVVLVNGNTASASEVFALALRDNLGATIIGDKTFGKGTVQTQVQDGVYNSFLKYTFAKWYSPLNESIDQVGIEPDIEVKLPEILYASYVTQDENEVIPYDSVYEGVAYVQKGLKFLGYHSGRTDGYYDDATRNALLSFKQVHSLGNESDIDHEIITNVYSAVIKEWSHHKNTHDTQLHKALEVVKGES